MIVGSCKNSTYKSSPSLTTVEMLIQKLDEALVATLALYQPRDILHHIKCVRPFVALCPPIVWTCPSPASIPRLHESSCRVEDGKGILHRTFSEKHLFVGLVQQAGQHGDSKVVVYQSVWGDLVSDLLKRLTRIIECAGGRLGVDIIRDPAVLLIGGR